MSSEDDPDKIEVYYDIDKIRLLSSVSVCWVVNMNEFKVISFDLKYLFSF